MMICARTVLVLLAAAALMPVAVVGQDTAAGFRWVEHKSKGALRLFEGDAPVLAYNFGDQLAQGVAEDRTRSSYVHPIYGLDGEVLTADFPKDHPHHRGLS